jgi:mono/diheme cytochrome c family protein
MNSEKKSLSALLLAGALWTPALWADDADKKLAEQAYKVLETNCARCHHGPNPKSNVEDYDVLDRASLIKQRFDEDKKPYVYVAPKDVKKSLIAQRVTEGSMPPQKVKIRPTDAEKVALKKWIEAGAPPFPPTPKK